MKIRFLALRNYIKYVCYTLSMSSVGYGGVVYDTIDYQIYKDFAANLGQFTAGAKDVTIYDKQGNIQGVIAEVPNFAALGVHPKKQDVYGNLVGSQSTVITAAHTTGSGETSFCVRYGITSGSAFYDSYNSVGDFRPPAKTSNGSYQYGNIDVRIQRTTKFVTDAVAFEHSTQSPDTVINTIVFNAGSGTHYTTSPDSTSTSQTQSSGTSALGGQMQIIATSNQDYVVTIGETSQSVNFTTYKLQFDDTLALPKGIEMGDSGSGFIGFNTETQKWEFLGVTALMYGIMVDNDPVYAIDKQKVDIVNSKEMHDFYQASYQQEINNTNVTTWTISGPNQTGEVSFTSDKGSSFNVQAMEAGLRGDTSTEGIRYILGQTIGTSSALATWEQQEAHDAKLAACKDWVFNNGGVELLIDGTIDTGAGGLYFNKDQSITGETHYKINPSSSDSSIRLNTAGYQIEKDVKVTSTLTGIKGDEWRVIGTDSSTGGIFEIKGNGNNQANLNIGIGATAILDRTNGNAVNNLKINTGAIVICAKEGQIGGNVVFGMGGGILDLNGTSLNMVSTNGSIQAYDKTGIICNTTNGTTSTVFLAQATGEFAGSFRDGASQSTPNSAKLNVNYSKDKGSLSLTGDSKISGNLYVNNGNVIIKGKAIEHATDFKQPNSQSTTDFQSAYFSAKEAIVATYGHLTVDAHGILDTKVTVNGNGKFTLNEGGTLIYHAGSNFGNNTTINGTIRADVTTIDTMSVNLNENGILLLENIGMENIWGSQNHVTNYDATNGDFMGQKIDLSNITGDGKIIFDLSNINFEKDITYYLTELNEETSKTLSFDVVSSNQNLSWGISQENGKYYLTSTHSIPEPTSSLFIAVGLLGVLSRRKRQNSSIK